MDLKELQAQVAKLQKEKEDLVAGKKPEPSLNEKALAALKAKREKDKKEKDATTT